MEPYFERLEKPWGFEIIYTPRNLPFTGKIAFTRAGERWSFQLHEKKEETICLIIGEAKLWLENEKGEIKKLRMDSLKGYPIKARRKHRFCAITDCWTVETSNPEEGKTVRLEDDYKRQDETEIIRKLPGRGWKVNRAHGEKS